MVIIMLAGYNNYIKAEVYSDKSKHTTIKKVRYKDQYCATFQAFHRLIKNTAIVQKYNTFLNYWYFRVINHLGLRVSSGPISTSRLNDHDEI